VASEHHAVRSEQAGAFHLPRCRPTGRAVGLDGLGLIQRELEKPGPTIFDVFLDVAQEFEPRLRSRILPDGKIQTPNLEDMYPFLTPEELADNMLVKDDV